MPTSIDNANTIKWYHKLVLLFCRNYNLTIKAGNEAQVIRFKVFWGNMFFLEVKNYTLPTPEETQVKSQNTNLKHYVKD